MRTKHTNGPWEVAARRGDDWESVVYIPNTPNEICQCFHDASNTDECTANARLISASPDLLAALKACEPYVPTCNPAGANARAAIAKAIGDA